MLHEEEPSGKVKGSQWPPAGSDVTHKPSSFFTKVSRGQGGRPVEWPPRPNQETENQVDNAPNMTTTYPSGFKLREKAPVEHQPARVVTSQPAFKMTQPIRKGGDSKWPPKGGMEPTQQEVREFIKPRKSNKDYSEFFAKNALPQNYAIYRPPPGTQHHGVEGEEEEGVSNM